MSFKALLKIANDLDASGDNVDALVSKAIDFALQDVAQLDMPDLTRVASLLAGFSNAMDKDGVAAVSSKIDEVLVRIANPDPNRESFYDSKKQREESMYTKTDTTPVVPRDPIYSGLKPHGVDALSTRHSPELPGVQMMRVTDGVYQDMLTKKIYDFNRGWVSEDGKKYPGGSVSAQTPAAQDYTSFPRALEPASNTRPR